MVSVLGIPALIAVLSIAPDWAAALLLAAMCGVGAWELLRAVDGWPALRPPLSCGAAAIPLLLYFFGNAGVALFALFSIFALFLAAIRAYEAEKAVPFSGLTAAIFAELVFPLLLSCLLRLRLLPGGGALVFVPLCVCFGSDTLALFAGLLFGKRKFAPRVSPKKTVEGAIGGLLGGVLGLTILKGILALLTLWGFHPGLTLDWATVVLLGLSGAAAGELGDLSFSVVKREFGVKDYGNILPGHGGVLDRFDSVTFAAPFVWCLAAIWGV